MKAFFVSLFCVFSLFLYSQDTVQKTILVSVKTLNKSKKSLKVTIDVLDSETKKVIKTLESKGKNTRIPLEAGRDYIVVFSRPGYLFQSVSILLSDSTVVKEKKLKNIVMEKVELNKKTVLNNLSFDIYQKIAEFESLPDLLYIMKLLESMPRLELEFGGYTCNSGSMSLSLKVSEEKAKTLVDYFVSKGANADRLKYKGYGSFQPVASNFSQEGRILNNRVELKVTGVNFVSSPERLQKIEPDSIYREQSAVKTVCSTASSNNNSTAETNSSSQVNAMAEINSSSETVFMPGINSNAEADSIPETSTMGGVNSAGESTEISSMTGINPAGENTEVDSMPVVDSSPEVDSASQSNTMSGSDSAAESAAGTSIDSTAENNSVSESNTMPSGINLSGESTAGTDTISEAAITAGHTTENRISGTDSTAEANTIAETNAAAGKDSAKTEQQGTVAADSAETNRSSPLTKEYRGMFIADKKPFANATVNLLTEKGKVYKTTKTDANGRFRFVGIPADKKLTVELNKKEIKKYQKVKLLDSASEIFGAIDAYFEDNSTIVPEDINAMIDYFFDN